MIFSVHEAQAYEDTRCSLLTSILPPPLPLEARREVTSEETWDDAVSLEEISQASRTLGSYALAGSGSANCLAIDGKLIFVGTSNSTVLLFDHFGVARGVLPGVGMSGGVTSLDSHQNTLILAGYGDGKVVLWDATNCTKVLDVINIPTNVPISLCRWYRGGQACVILDSSGVANLIKFSKGFLLSTYAMDKKLLLDGRARNGLGPVFACRVLNTDSSIGLALTVSNFTLIVGLEPEPTRVVYKWEIVRDATVPVGVQGDSGGENETPCLAYHPLAVVEKNIACPTVIRCLGTRVEYARLDSMLDFLQSMTSDIILPAPTIACEWISDCCVSFLDSTYQFRILDTVTNLFVGKCDATGVQLVKFNFILSHPDLNTYENSIRTFKAQSGEDVAANNNNSLYLLGVGELVKVGIQPWSLRVDRLVKSGQWLEALTLSLKYYRTILLPFANGTINSNTNGKTPDFGLGGGLMSAIRDGSKVADLLKRYLAFQLASSSLSADVGAVCIEYAISINRLDLIFEDVFDAFSQRGGKKSIQDFMSVLNPFILSSKITATPPPVVLSALLEYCTEYCTKENLECIFLLLDHIPEDLDGSIRLCKEKKIPTAMCRLYSEGLSDFVTPIQVVLNWMQDDLSLWNEFGYRMFLYLSYSLLGVEFPKGNIPLSREKADLARVSLLSYFFPSGGQISEDTLNDQLFACLEFDTKSFLRVLEQASGFEEEHEILRWLIVAASKYCGGGGEKEGRSEILFDFVARHVSHMRKQREDVTLENILTPPLAIKLFQQYVINKTELCVELIERFPQNPDWYLDRIVDKEKHPVVVATLLRIKLKTSKNPSEAFREAFESFLKIETDAQIILDFVREQKDKFSQEIWFIEEISSKAKILLNLDSNLSAKLLIEIQPNVESILKYLAGDSASQFALLKPLVGARAFGEEVTLDMVQRFIRLLVEREPEQAYEWLSKNEGRYSLDEALETCRAKKIDDATAYLLERAGKVEEALDLVLRSVRGSFRKNDRKGLEQSALVAINLCFSFSVSKEKDDMWFRVLDTFLEVVSSESDFHLVESIVDNMMPHVTLERLIGKIKQLESSNHFRPAIMGMLEAFRRELSILSVANRTLRQDLVFVEQQKRAQRVKGTRIKSSTLSQFTYIPIENNSKIRRRRSLYISREKDGQQQKSVSGFDDYEALEACWTSLFEDPQRLQNNLLIGTKYELNLMPVVKFREELIDAGL